jgi:hypothetical protein
VNDRDVKLNSDFITDEMQGLERRDFLRLGGLSAIWALAIAMAPRFLFGAYRQPASPKTLLKAKNKFSRRTATMESQAGSGSHRLQAFGHEGSIPQNQTHLGVAAKQ